MTSLLRRLSQWYYGPDTVRVVGKTVILPAMGPVAMVEGPRLSASARKVTINRTSGVRFVCFCKEDGQDTPSVKEGLSFGVEVRVDMMVPRSDGTGGKNPRSSAGALKRLRRVDKAIARSHNIDGSNNHSYR